MAMCTCTIGCVSMCCSINNKKFPLTTSIGLVTQRFSCWWQPSLRILGQLFQNSPCGGDVTKEPMWTFDIDYITQNNKNTIVSNAMHVFYDCSMSTIHISSFVWYERFVKLAVHDFGGLCFH